MPTKYMDTEKLAALRSGKKLSAAWAQLGSNLSAEIMAEAGFDILVIDMEHAPITLNTLVPMVQAMKGTGCLPFVRTPWNDMVWIKHILDTGVYGLHIPYVGNRQEAEFAVKNAKYAPSGHRGIAGSHRAANYGMSKAEYFPRANEELMIICAIETYEGVKNIDEIVSVPGVDGIFIGPMDLSTSMGHLADPSAPDVREAIRIIETAVFKTDKFLSTLAPNIKAAKELYDRGYGLVYTFSDVTTMSALALEQVKEFKELIAD